MSFAGDSIYWVEVNKVVPNPFQPRRVFDEHKLQELADSIRMYGVLQPLTVTRNEIQRDDGTFYTEYELIAGERRLRASKLAQVSQVPVIIREGEESEQEKLELAIIENLQREDLNAVDRALAFKQLADVFGLSHAQVAHKVGRSREYVSNSIRLLGLPEHMLDALRRSDFTEGHARTLLMLNDRPEEQEVLFQETLLKKMSVREVERIARKIATDKVRKKQPGDIDDQLIEIERQFTETLGTRVQIQKTDFGGKLTIDYFSTEDLEVILKKVKDESDKTTPSESDTVIATETEAVINKLIEHTPLETISTQNENNNHYPREVIEEKDSFLTHKSDDTVPVPLENVSYTAAPAIVENNPSESETPIAVAGDTTISEPEEVPQEEAKPELVEKNEDESGLYSINNFTV